MKNFIQLMAILMVVSIAACTHTGMTKKKSPGQNPEMVMVWETPEGLSVPESVLYDKKNQILYVANINGKPTLKNKKGFIARVNLDGSIKDNYWITGLNAPKGMGIIGDTLYVTDIDRVVAIDIPGARIIKVWHVAGAKFLNDIAVDGHGNVFITDMMTQTIHMIKDGKLDSFLVLDYNRPNGLFMSGRTLLVGTAAGVLAIDIQSRDVNLEIDHKGGIDGLKSIGNGRFIVSDWKGKVQIIEKGQMPVVLMDTSTQKINAADFEYIPERNLILIPTFFNNRVVAYELK